MPDVPAPNVLDATCPSRQVLDLIANKWTVLIFWALTRDIRHYGQLQRAVGGISHKMLNQTLRNLERHGLLTRIVYEQTLPPVVEYALTPLGKSLAEPIQGLCHWAEGHLSALEQATPVR